MAALKPWSDHPAPRAGLCYTARVDPRHIAYLVCLTEAYDGLAIVRTKDRALGIVEFWISPLMRRDFESFLQAMRQELGLAATEPAVCDVSAPGGPAGET